VIWTKGWEDKTGGYQPHSVVSDTDYIYVAGYTYSSPYYRRIEKRSKSDGVLIWVKTNDPDVDYRPTSMTSDTDYIYITGSSKTMEKRSKSNGALIWKVSTSTTIPDSITSDSDYLYISTRDISPGDAQWHIEKRSKSDGALIWVKTNNPSSGYDRAWSIIFDMDYLYIAGWDYSSGNAQWRIEKHDIVAPSALPAYSNFKPHPETTNFSEETNLTDVKNLTLGVTDKGKIKFADDYGINAESEDYDANIVIENASISINTSALDSTFNSSATLTFYNIDCGSPLVYYSDTSTTRYNILAEDNQCLAPRCTNIQCVDSILTVDVAHFSGYAISGSVNLSIDADDPKFVLEDVTFTAIYMNLTGGFIAGATCNIRFADGSYIMDEQADHYNYTKAFAAAQTVDYNVTCSKTGYNTVFANDTAIINEIPVPEFSLLTLGIGLIAVLIGLFVIRRKR